MSIVKQVLALDKLARLWDIVKFNGGIKNSIKTLFVTDNLKKGRLVGTDKAGNRYYENNEYMHGANRWVIYSDKVYLDYDGSQIPAEWHGWMHYSTDVPPTEAKYPQHRWMIDYVENQSGTVDQYVPYSTTRPKIASWQPKK